MPTSIKQLASRQGLEKLLSKIITDKNQLDVYKASFLTLVSTFVSQVFTFLTFTYAARFLGAEQFGEFSIVYNSVLFLSVIIIFGLNLPLTQIISERIAAGSTASIPSYIRQAYLLVLAIFLVYATAFLLFTDQISLALTGSADPIPLLIASFYLFFFCYNTIQISVIVGFKEYKKLAWANFFKGLTMPLIFLSFFFFEENGIFIGFSLHMLLCSLFNQWLLSKIFKGRVFSGQMTESRVDIFKSLLGKAVPFLLSSIFVYPITWFTNRILVEQPDGLYELGLFNTTFQWRSIIIFFPMTIGQVLIPIFTSSIVTGDITKIKRVLKLSIVASAVVSVGFTVIILLLYPFLLNFYGDDFNISIQLVIVTGLYTTISAVLLPMGNLINAAGKFWTGFYVNLGWAVVLVIAAWFLLINNYGAEGLAISYLIAYAFHMVWVVIFVFNYLKKASLHSERI